MKKIEDARDKPREMIVFSRLNVVSQWNTIRYKRKGNANQFFWTLKWANVFFRYLHHIVGDVNIFSTLYFC